MEPSSGPAMRRSVKAHLLASQELLVDSLYNVAPLLDSMLACGLLSQENYHEVKAERTPLSRARRLLDVVQAQMDETGASRFLDCLRRCHKHYPRLNPWLQKNTSAVDIPRGPTECQIQAQFSVLCARLGHSVLPVSLALFSAGIVTQLELEQVQAIPTLYQQAQKLLSICLSKGEGACQAFYQALREEDETLADDIGTVLTEALPAQPTETGSEVSSFAIAVQELSNGTSEVTGHRSGLKSEWGPDVLTGSEASSFAIPVEETSNGTSGMTGHRSDLTSACGPDILQQVRGHLDVVSGEEARLNVCELGTMLGLPHWLVQEAVLEDIGVGDKAQLEAVVNLFLQRTHHSALLLSRVQKCHVQQAQLSARGCLLLKLLQEAHALQHHTDFRQAGDQACSGPPRATVEATLRFLLWDCMAQTLEEPVSEAGRTLLELVTDLRACELLDASLLQELWDCLSERGQEDFGMAVQIVSQVIRDLYPRLDTFHLSKAQDGRVWCRPLPAWRVTRFKGLPARVIRKVVGNSRMAPSVEGTDPGVLSLDRQHLEICQTVVRLLERVYLDAGVVELPLGSENSVSQQLRAMLSGEAFCREAFNAGLRHRLLGLVEFGHLQGPTIVELHSDTLSELQNYLRRGEHHSYRMLVESVWMLGRVRLCYVERAQGPFAIDHGIEQIFRFVIAEPASFVVKVCCQGYEEDNWFEAHNPRCVLLSQSESASLRDSQGHMEGTVIAEEGGNLWVRGPSVDWVEGLRLLTLNNNQQITDQGCCFKVTCYGSECKVKFIFRNGQISASAITNCEIL